MDFKHREIIYELLSTGIYTKGKIEGLNEIKSIFRKIHFDVIEWYDKSCYVLTSTGNRKELIIGYNEDENKEILNIFENIIYEQEVQGNIFNSLVENGWVDLDKSNKPILSKRTMVIFKDKILETGGAYKMCRICSFLVYKDDIHEYCADILSEKTLL